MRTKHLIDNLSKDINLNLKEPWDPIGFSIPLAGKKNLKNVLVCHDVTSKVIQEAIKNDCNLIISHHPFIFYEKAKDFEIYPYKKNLYKTLKAHKINTYSFHTAFDKSDFLTVKGILKLLNLDDNGFRQVNSEFALKINWDKTPLELIKLLKNRASVKNIQTNIKQKVLETKINSFMLFPGSGFVGDINKFKDETDLIITSDAKWSDFINYDEMNINIINVSHNLEKGFIYIMVDLLKKYLDPSQIFSIFEEDKFYNI
ncbi:Nif3-like dinuclear metal center hexameric protein [Mycoplasma zalophi]|uniref:Nif3-like dinuclear metal center hexameric protein n=1 Tax=Mycoplasma zalophi TaxID=191287 RepID=A0ABS6DQ65_9MOLU|nr:Nif3-like dinuclear metal center hexameric protein [Mycoplasma zalophi]MBU4692454.1 Nif3-like dinuclear metal center hexameric protein [Mycoplasma zalophi]